MRAIFPLGTSCALLVLVAMPLSVRCAGLEVPSLSADQLTACWADLVLDDEAGTQQAFHAMLALAAAPDDTAAFLSKHLRPVPALPAADQDALRASLADLESADFRTRVRAEKAIEQIGERARPTLQARLAEKPALEVRRRIESLLERIDNRPLSGEELRELRAIEVLRLLGTDAARELLTRLADGGAGARRTEAARAALKKVAGGGR